MLNENDLKKTMNAIENSGPQEGPLKILVVDDHPMIVSGLAFALDKVNITHAPNVASCLARLQEADHDLVILDFFLPDGDGIWALSKIRARVPCMPVLMFSSMRDPVRIETCMAMGANGFVNKDASASQLLQAIHAVLRGEPVIWPSTSLPAPGALPLLSSREMEVLSLLARGLSNRNISDSLYISENTVKTHISSIFSKLGVQSRSEAAYVFNYKNESNG